MVELDFVSKKLKVDVVLPTTLNNRGKNFK